jgi:orotidine-5'-phosphate decarboxylase
MSTYSHPDSIVPPTQRLNTARDRLIVALDYATAPAALDLVARLENRVAWFKVGLELFIATGPSIIEILRARGFHVFVDLKLHDIPNTVAGAVRSLAASGASLLTVHGAGGRPMLLAASEAADSIPNGPELVAVTVLTSMDAQMLAQTGVPDTPISQAVRLAKLAHAAGVSGMVCSPQECPHLRAYLGPYRLLVVPGIRPAGFPSDDQSRISTPAMAIHDGASLLVVGRPITRAPDPAAAADAILIEMDRALESLHP